MKHIPIFQEENAMKMYITGYSITDICSECGITEYGLKKLIKENNLEEKSMLNRKMLFKKKSYDELYKKIEDLYFLKGNTMKNISETFKIDIKRVRKVILNAKKKKEELHEEKINKEIILPKTKEIQIEIVKEELKEPKKIIVKNVEARRDINRFAETILVFALP